MRNEAQRVREARAINRRYAHEAQKDPAVRRRTNIIMLGIVLPILVLIVGSLVVFFSQHPDGIPR